MLDEPLDRAALAGRVPSFEHDDVLQVVVLAVVLELEQLDLQQVLLLLVVLPRHQLVVGVVLAPGLDRAAPRIDQLRIRPLAIGNGVSGGNQLVDELPQVVVGIGLELVQIYGHGSSPVGLPKAYGFGPLECSTWVAVWCGSTVR